MIHKLPISKYGEYTCGAYNEETYQKQEDEDEWQFWSPEKRKITDFFKLPTFHECC
jgi:hypothetical protein